MYATSAQVRTGYFRQRTHTPQAKKIHDIHVEVLKRADGLLCFMADHGMFLDKHLDLLWEAGRGQPDAQV